MDRIRLPSEMAAWSEAARGRGDRIAFVPTMGILHAGHLALLEAGRRRADRLVLSIFVNPTQFGPGEDIERYPRDVDGDLVKARGAGVDAAFVPDAGVMYPPAYSTVVAVPDLERGLCGDRRPGHFSGVATVVCKLLNIVRPQVALFGEKDFQQLAIVRRMVRDLDLPVDVVGIPTVRDGDGLALSSRNVYLGPAQCRRAGALFRGLAAARDLHLRGEREPAVLLAAARPQLDPDADELEYLEIRDAETLAELERVDRPAVIAVAARVGGTRLIDNVRLG